MESESNPSPPPTADAGLDNENSGLTKAMDPEVPQPFWAAHPRIEIWKLDCPELQHTKEVIDFYLRYPYELRLTNVHQDALYPQIVMDHLPKVRSARALRLSGQCVRTLGPIIWYGDLADAQKVIEELGKIKDWSWNGGFKVKVKDLRVISDAEGGTRLCRTLLHLSLKPNFIREAWDDIKAAFVPGTLLWLPEYKHRKAGSRMDVQLTREDYGNPVIIVRGEKEGLVNIVVCSSFNWQKMESVVPPEGYKHYYWTEIESAYARHKYASALKCGDKPTKQTMLFFDTKHTLVRRYYARAKVYTVELTALARLPSRAVCGRSHEVPGGYLTIKDASIEILFKRLRRYGSIPHLFNETSAVGSWDEQRAVNYYKTINSPRIRELPPGRMEELDEFIKEGDLAGDGTMTQKRKSNVWGRLLGKAKTWAKIELGRR